MGKFSLRRFDTQARASVVLSLVSLLPLLAMVGFILTSNLDREQLLFYYGARRKIAILGSALMALLLAAGGFGFGLNSAGQRRNDKPQLSWIGFFTGALVLSLTCVLIFLFMSRGEQAIVAG